MAAEPGGPDPELLAELRVLQGEAALAADDLSGARRRAQEALGDEVPAAGEASAGDRHGDGPDAEEGALGGWVRTA